MLSTHSAQRNDVTRCLVIEPLECRLALSAAVVGLALDVPNALESAPKPPQSHVYYIDDPVTVTGTWAGSFEHNEGGDRTRLIIRIGEPDASGRVSATLVMRQPGQSIETVLPAEGIVQRNGNFWLAWEVTRVNSGRVEGTAKAFQTSLDARMEAVIDGQRVSAELRLHQQVGTGKLFEPGKPIEPNGGLIGGVLGEVPVGQVAT